MYTFSLGFWIHFSCQNCRARMPFIFIARGYYILLPCRVYPHLIVIIFYAVFVEPMGVRIEYYYLKNRAWLDDPAYPYNNTQS